MSFIYTHHHGTQVMGARVFREPGTRVVAHRDTVLEFDLIHEMNPYYKRLNSIQFNFENIPGRPVPNFAYPDITYADRYTLELGGTTFELRHESGEARDYTVVEIPERGVVWSGDLAGNMPMVASPMKRVRDEVKWRHALERIRESKPQVLIPSVHQPICDSESIDKLLGVHIDFLDFLHDEVVRLMNEGVPAWQAVKQVTMPEKLKKSGLLKERYGRLEYAVRGLLHKYSGWFDQNGTNLHPIEEPTRAKSFVEAMGGGQDVLKKARQLGTEQPRLALEYLDLLVHLKTYEAKARKYKSEILAKLGETAEGRISKSIYKACSREERELGLKLDN